MPLFSNKHKKHYLNTFIFSTFRFLLFIIFRVYTNRQFPLSPMGSTILYNFCFQQVKDHFCHASAFPSPTCAKIRIREMLLMVFYTIRYATAEVLTYFKTVDRFIHNVNGYWARCDGFFATVTSNWVNRQHVIGAG